MSDVRKRKRESHKNTDMVSDKKLKAEAKTVVDMNVKPNNSPTKSRIMLEDHSVSYAPPFEAENEWKNPLDLSDYNALADIPNFRDLLNTAHGSTVTIPFLGLRFHTVDHIMNYLKYYRKHRGFAYLFSLDSASDLCFNSQLANAACSPTGTVKLGKNVIFQRNLHHEVHPDYFRFLSQSRQRAYLAKYLADENARAALLATNNALLMRTNTESLQVELRDLMLVRDQLRHLSNKK